jgi:hypothetical protein
MELAKRTGVRVLATAFIATKTEVLAAVWRRCRHRLYLAGISWPPLLSEAAEAHRYVLERKALGRVLRRYHETL